MTHYQQTIFAKAHVTPDEFFLRNQRRRRRPMTSYGAAKDMLQATPVQKVMQTIRQNPIDRQQWNAYEQSLQNCDPEFKLSTPNNNNNAISALLARGPSQRGILGLAGFGGEVGAILGGEVEFFFAYPNATPVFFIHIGGGLLAGIDAGVTATLGMAFTGEPADIPGVGFELDLQIPIPIVGPGVSVGVDINNVWDLTFNLNLGVGIAIGGFSAGYTWGFPENDPSTGGANFTTTAAAAAANSSNSGASGSIGGL